MDLVEARRLWDPQPGWLNTASYGLPPRPAWEALRATLEDWRVGRTSWEGWDEYVARSRAAFARLTGVPVSDVAIGGTVSGLLAPIAAALPVGATVLVAEEEFTSNLFPWLAQAERGVEVRTVPLAGLLDAVDASVDLVAVSLVQSADGRVAPYRELAAAASAADALLVVDATQACGWLPFDGTLADVVVVHAYKWLMAPRGAAFGYLGPRVRDRTIASAAGWYAGADVHESYYGLPLRLADGARRFDTSPAWFSFVGAAPAMELLLDVGLPAIRAYNVGLANRFLAGLGRPAGDSAIVAVDVPDAERRLRSAGVRAAVRNGRLRASFHLYSTDADVDMTLAALTG
ncbi:aminotransferase class V-fold PLP-dependent enzyme [Plantactinospora sp. GCM10030261]|uniref:aminotransferase class V-fold PLP-dependent enzyme n=1 Tax=Plantactinospora sp. GCM10030261 TaxID=3273420 RepID=UPI00361A7B41